jgi:hypothetical protein
MKTKVRKIRDEFLVFHRDQRGESSTLSNVMMLAVAAIVVVALIAFGKTAFEWLYTKWKGISESEM